MVGVIVVFCGRIVNWNSSLVVPCYTCQSHSYSIAKTSSNKLFPIIVSIYGISHAAIVLFALLLRQCCRIIYKWETVCISFLDETYGQS